MEVNNLDKVLGNIIELYSMKNYHLQPALKQLSLKFDIWFEKQKFDLSSNTLLFVKNKLIGFNDFKIKRYKGIYTIYGIKPTTLVFLEKLKNHIFNNMYIYYLKGMFDFVLDSCNMLILKTYYFNYYRQNTALRNKQLFEKYLSSQISIKAYFILKKLIKLNFILKDSFLQKVFHTFP